MKVEAHIVSFEKGKRLLQGIRASNEKSRERQQVNEIDDSFVSQGYIPLMYLHLY